MSICCGELDLGVQQCCEEISKSCGGRYTSFFNVGISTIQTSILSLARSGRSHRNIRPIACVKQ